MESFESYLKRMKSWVIDSLSGIDRPISDSDMVLKLLDLLPSEDKYIKEGILSLHRLPSFKHACYIVYKVKLGCKDPVRGTPRNVAPAIDTIGKAGDVVAKVGEMVDHAGNIGGMVDAVGQVGVPIAAAVSSVTSVAGAIGPLGLPIKALGLVIFLGCKILQRSRN